MRGSHPRRKIQRPLLGAKKALCKDAATGEGQRTAQPYEVIRVRNGKRRKSGFPKRDADIVNCIHMLKLRE